MSPLKSILQILSDSYRVNTEEQDDPVVWLTHVLKSHSVERPMGVFFTDSSVNYLRKGAKAVPLQIASWRQSHPLHIYYEIEKLQAKGIRLYAAAEDCAQFKLMDHQMLPGVELILKKDRVALYSGFDLLWRW